MRKRFIFAIALVLLLAASAITFARNTATNSVTINLGAQAGLASNIQTADDYVGANKLKHSSGAGPYTNVAPTWSPVLGDPGSITAGDLYYIDTQSYTGDVYVTLYISNPDALSLDYSYLNMKANVWYLNGANWDQATLVGPDVIGDVFLTLENGFVSFLLEGNTQYCISLDGGNYYLVDTNALGGDLSPDFYIEVEPL